MSLTFIFDIDGTLIDSVDSHALAWQEIFRRYGYDIPLLDIRRQIGKGGDQLMPEFLSDQDLEESGNAISNDRSKLFRDVYMKEIEAFPKVRELLQRLHDDGHRVILASSGSAQEVKAYERLAHIDDLVDGETSADDVSRSKPHPDVFQAALKKAGSPRSDDVVVIGDAPYDAIASKRAGLRCIGVLSGGFGEDELRDAGCLAVYRDPADLLDHYDRLVTPEP